MADFIYNTKHLELEILYEDADFVVVAKPPGILSVPGTLPELQDSVLTRIRTRYNNPGAEAVHRLDMATSGIILIALSKEAEVELKRQFRDRETQKTYYALVRGKVKFTKQFIELPLSTDWPLRPRQKVDFSSRGKYALTECEFIEYYPKQRHSLVRLSPHTGRSHQLRVHMLSTGHPIVGDKFYDEYYFIQPYHRMCLHAGELKFTHPTTGKEMHFVHQPDFAKDYKLGYLEALGLKME